MKKLCVTIALLIVLSLNAQALFEVKDGDNTVLEVATDGLRIFNMGDTLMVISSSEIKAFIDESAKDKALSRSFSVTTSAASGKGQGDILNIAPDGLRVFSDNANLMDITSGNITAYIDTSYSFNVTSTTGGKLDTDVLEVGADATKMREGAQGEQYTDFSPENIFIGLNAGSQTVPDTTAGQGVKNVFIGNNAGYSNTGGYENIFIGINSGYSTSGTYNTAMGAYSLSANTWGGQNTAIGYESMVTSTQGQQNTAVGMWTLKYNEDGCYNTSVGMYSGWGNVVGDYNTSIGFKSYDYGASSGGAHTYCTFLGHDADISSVFTFTNGTAVGNGAKVSDDDQVRVGNASVTSIGGYAGWTTLTKKGSAKSINEDIVGLEFIKKLRPISYTLDVELINNGLGIEENPEDTNIKGSISRSENLKRSGFLAEEVEQAAKESGYDFSGLDKPGNKDDQYGLRYSEFVIPLIKAVQEQQIMIEELRSEIKELKENTTK